MSLQGPVLTLLNRLRLRQVALLMEVRSLGTLRAAADRLGMTQPAATNMLKELEAALGLQLFERAGRGLRVTQSGDAVMAHFDGLCGSIATMSREFDYLRSGGSRYLAIGSILAPSPTVLTRTIVRLKNEQPGLRLSVLTETSDRLLDMLDEGALDLVIGRMAEGHAHRDYISRVLEGEPLSIVVGPQHPQARSRSITLPALVEQPWVLQPRGSPMREALEQEFRRQGLDTPADLVETASILTTIFLVAEAPMVAVVPTSLASRYAEKDLIRILPIQLVSEMEPYGSILRKGRPISATAARFLELLHQDERATTERSAATASRRLRPVSADDGPALGARRRQARP